MSNNNLLLIFLSFFNLISFDLQATSEHGGWITKSDLSVTIGENDKNKMISCYAINQELGQTIQETHMISVLCKYYLSMYSIV